MIQRPGEDLFRVSPNFHLPMNLTAEVPSHLNGADHFQMVEAEQRRQRRIQDMVVEQGEDLAALSTTGESKSDEIITDSEGSEDPMLVLKMMRVSYLDLHLRPVERTRLWQ